MNIVFRLNSAIYLLRKWPRSISPLYTQEIANVSQGKEGEKARRREAAYSWRQNGSLEHDERPSHSAKSEGLFTNVRWLINSKLRLRFAIIITKLKSFTQAE